MNAPDGEILADDWSDLARIRPMPEIDRDRLHRYRTERLRDQLRRAGAEMAVLVNPVSLRQAIDYRCYGVYQSRIPTTYLFYPLDGPVTIHGAYGRPEHCDAVRPARMLNVMDGGPDLADAARLFADDVVRYLSEIGASGRRVAVECLNPSITQALLQRGVEVIDGMAVAEQARVIKSTDEIACIRWALAVAEHGMAKMQEVLRPGVSEQQLWGVLNYANLANDGDWHDGRMLASGPRTNPWLQETSARRVEAGDLVAFDTDMVGPGGYCADISRTFFCGPGRPTARQKQLYRLAAEEIAWNRALVRPGLTFAEFQAAAWPIPEEFQAQSYVCLTHAVGMCDEYPRINHAHRGPVVYDGVIEAGMVLCIESYMGAVGERDGVKLEEQVLVTETGCETLSSYPLEAALLD